MTLLDELSSAFKVGRLDLERFIKTAPARYKVYTIPKRNGGTRTIAQPSAALKSLQRYLLSHKLNCLPVHHAASAYVIGKSILDNAKCHRENRYILKMDFTSFFPSIVVADFRRIVRRVKPEQIDQSDLPIYEKLLFWGAGGIKATCLSIGAPSSPCLSNAVLYDLDVLFSGAAAKRHLTYTRYADDITISGDSVSDIISVEKSITNILLKTKSPHLFLNQDKRGLYGPGSRRLVTGLILTPDHGVSIGRDRKRMISAMLHRALCGEIDVLELARLKGLLGFCISSEPSFVNRMREKYGNDLVDRVLRSPLLEPKNSGMDKNTVKHTAS